MTSLRIGRTILLRSDAAASAYLEFHRDVWPGVERAFRDHGVRGYSIFLHRPTLRLFSMAEYRGEDYEGDMAAIGADPECRRWSAECARFQVSGASTGWERLTDVWSLPA